MPVNFDTSVRIFYCGQQRILDFYGIWSGHWQCLQFWHVFGFWILIFDVLLILHIVLNISQMSEVIRGSFVLSTCIAYTLKVLCFKLNNFHLLRLFGQLHGVEFHPENPQEECIFGEARALSRRIFKYYGIISVTALTMVILSQYAIDNTELPLATYNPFSDEPGSFGYCFAYAYQSIALSLACFMNISFDSLCCSLFIFVRCQLDMLAWRLQHLGHDEEPQEHTLKQQLQHCIDYYMHIVELAANIERMVYKPISAQIFCSVVVLTANFYAMSLLSDEKLVFLKFFIYQSCMLMQVFILCYFAGEITQRSAELPHQLYKSNWVGWPRANRRLLFMFMQRLGTSVRIRTLNASHAFDLALFSSVWFFHILGLWQPHLGATRLQRCQHQLRFWIFFGIVAIMLLFFGIRVLGSLDQLSVILQVFFMFATEMSCMMKLLNIRLRQQQHAQLITMMHATHFRPRSDQETVVFKDACSLAIRWRNCYGIMSSLAAGLILVTQWFVDNSALPLSMYEPCSLSSAGCYYGLYTYHVLSLMPTCWLNIAFDSIVPALLIFLRVQLAMLSMRLQNLGAVQSDEEDERIGLELRDCCLQYRRIVRLQELVDGFIKVPESTQLLCSVLVLISNFYDMSINTGETAFMIKTAMYQFVMLLQIFLVCKAANDVTYQSSLLSNALYSAEWTSWSKANRKMCLLMMLRFDTPLEMRTINHTQTFSLPTFASIVNCSYSYFALLKRVNS